jgi:hypothetical protein
VNVAESAHAETMSDKLQFVDILRCRWLSLLGQLGIGCCCSEHRAAKLRCNVIE